MITELRHPDGLVTVQETATGRHIRVQPGNPELGITRRNWVTRYPISLIQTILKVKGISHVCDEIARDEDPSYVEHHMEYDVLSYIEPKAFQGKRILDFGCGSGASTMVLSRKLPGAFIVGVELEEELLAVARLRAQYYNTTNIEFFSSPSGTAFPPGLGQFDAILFSAVYEHLLPPERVTLLPLLWRHLALKGILFLNQTPYRYSPIESHTTDLPFINYLPDSAAFWAARKFSKRVGTNETWENLLRAGIRGGTIREITGILSKAGMHPIILNPTRQGMKDRIDLWYNASSPRWQGAKRMIRLIFKAIKALTGIEMTFSLSLAIQKWE